MFNPASGHSLFLYFPFFATFDLLYGRKVWFDIFYQVPCCLELVIIGRNYLFSLFFYLLSSIPTSADTKADTASDLASNARFQVCEKEL